MSSIKRNINEVTGKMRTAIKIAWSSPKKKVFLSACLAHFIIDHYETNQQSDDYLGKIGVNAHVIV